ncbi:hypothetical protein VTN00DRAFT_9771 [Thermoascus crustaceus]|uniref:uncharacterized protein n=1 Tax=Thermoascus crustaceus TaxID=5088 RepID=UPI003743AD5E
MENVSSYLVEALQEQQQPLTEAVRTILNASPQQLLKYTLLGFLAYPALVSLLRFRRLRSLHKKYHYPTRESMAEMTNDDAWEIQKATAQLEFPFMYTKALQFALFRTYGIPSVSRLLAKTSEFSKPQTALKRYSDTSALVVEFIAHAPSDDRGRSAIARINYLHSGYRASGKILEDDMLYTLSLFAIQPIKFIAAYEWRELSELEKCAIGTFWKSVGDAMEISYEALPSSKTGFRDGLHWLEEITAWSEDYESKNMVPDQKNRETADQTTTILVYMLPEPLKHIGLKFVSFMMDDRLRKAMLYEPPPPSYARVFSALISIRKFFLRYLALPRPYFFRHLVFSEPNKHGRVYVTVWEAAPYYVEPTFWNRWGPTAWLTWALGKPLPGDEGDKYYPSGYNVPDMGPKHFEGKGREYMERQKETMRKERTGGCPFH